MIVQTSVITSSSLFLLSPRLPKVRKFPFVLSLLTEMYGDNHNLQWAMCSVLDGAENITQINRGDFESLWMRKHCTRIAQSRFVSCHITDAASVWFPL